MFAEFDYEIDALIQHAEGIDEATLYWTIDTAAGYNAVSMSNSSGNTWSSAIPFQQAGEKVYYYIHAGATNGKEQVRPMPAPEGFWKFKVLSSPTGITENELSFSVYPNPTSGIARVRMEIPTDVEFTLSDQLGRVVDAGLRNGAFNIDLSGLRTGVYALTLNWGGGQKSYRLQKL